MYANLVVKRLTGERRLLNCAGKVAQWIKSLPDRTEDLTSNFRTQVKPDDHLSSQARERPLNAPEFPGPPH